MFIDSHCHLDRLDLATFENNFDVFMQAAEEAGIDHMLCIGIDLEAYPAMCELVAPYANISLSAGVHPNVTEGREPDLDELVSLASAEKVIAVGETGLDYFRSDGDLGWQHARFVTHIKAAKIVNKPLIIHTREAGQDSLDVLEREGADKAIIHCFTEDWAYAERALHLGYYISFSGIVTFKNAEQIKEVARKVPEDRFLIETDSPYLAPVPFRGKPNNPTYVCHVAQHLADLRGCSLEQIAEQSTLNFNTLFELAAA